MNQFVQKTAPCIVCMTVVRIFSRNVPLTEPTVNLPDCLPKDFWCSFRAGDNDGQLSQSTAAAYKGCKISTGNKLRDCSGSARRQHISSPTGDGSCLSSLYQKLFSRPVSREQRYLLTVVCALVWLLAWLLRSLQFLSKIKSFIIFQKFRNQNMFHDILSNYYFLTPLSNSASTLGTFLYPYLSLSIYLSLAILSISIYLSILANTLTFYLYVSIHLYLSLSLSLSLSVSLASSLSGQLSIYPSGMQVPMYIYICVYACTNMLPQSLCGSGQCWCQPGKWTSWSYLCGNQLICMGMVPV